MQPVETDLHSPSTESPSPTRFPSPVRHTLEQLGIPEKNIANPKKLLSYLQTEENKPSSPACQPASCPVPAPQYYYFDFSLYPDKDPWVARQRFHSGEEKGSRLSSPVPPNGV